MQPRLHLARWSFAISLINLVNNTWQTDLRSSLGLLRFTYFFFCDCILLTLSSVLFLVTILPIPHVVVGIFLTNITYYLLCPLATYHIRDKTTRWIAVQRKPSSISANKPSRLCATVSSPLTAVRNTRAFPPTQMLLPHDVAMQDSLLGKVQSSRKKKDQVQNPSLGSSTSSSCSSVLLCCGHGKHIPLNLS